MSNITRLSPSSHTFLHFDESKASSVPWSTNAASAALPSSQIGAILELWHTNRDYIVDTIEQMDETIKITSLAWPLSKSAHKHTRPQTNISPSANTKVFVVVMFASKEKEFLCTEIHTGCYKKWRTKWFNRNSSFIVNSRKWHYLFVHILYNKKKKSNSNSILFAGVICWFYHYKEFGWNYGTRKSNFNNIEIIKLDKNIEVVLGILT